MNDVDMIPIPAFDDRVVRRAMLRGVVRTGLVASLCMMLLVLLVGAASVGISAYRGDHFFRVAYGGMVVSHPEYEIKQDGNCCAAGPLFGFTNLGLASEIKLQLRPLGALNYAGAVTITVEQDVFGDLHPGIDASPTPLRNGLQRGRPTKESTEAFLRGLPEPTVVSALIEFDQPVEAAAFTAFFDTYLPSTDISDRRRTIIAVNPYESRSSNLISWPNSNIAELRAWAASLDLSDDRHLDAVGLAPSADIKQVADEGRIYAFVAPRIPLALLRTLLGNTAVRSVNVLDVAFDTSRQFSR